MNCLCSATSELYVAPSSVKMLLFVTKQLDVKKYQREM